jgi:hypothetical protein
MVVWVAALVKAVDAKTAPSLMLLPVMTLWANVHGSIFVGLALTVALAAEAVFESPSGELLLVARRWAVFLVAAVGAACITPYGARPFLMAFQAIGANEAKPYLTEWRAVSFETVPIEVFGVLAFVFLALLNGAKIRFCRLTILLLIAAYMLTAEIHIPIQYNYASPRRAINKAISFLRLSQHIATQPRFFDNVSARAARSLWYLCNNRDRGS